MAELFLAFLKNRGFGKNRVSNFTKSSSIFSGFFRVLLLPCEKDKKLRKSYHGILPGSHQDSVVRKCWRPTHPPQAPLTTAQFLHQLCQELSC